MQIVLLSVYACLQLDLKHVQAHWLINFTVLSHTSSRTQVLNGGLCDVANHHLWIVEMIAPEILSISWIRHHFR
jgi:hypothetical protein